MLLAAAPLQAQGAEVTDTAGRKVQVPANPKRIVCLGPGCLRLIVYLQAQDKVVGIESMEKRRGGRPYILAQPQLLSLPQVSPGGPSGINKKPDLEGILKVKPDLVFITYMQADKADDVQKLLGVPVVVLTYGRFAAFDKAVYDSLRIAGKILGKDKRAQEVIAFMEAGQKDLRQRVAQVKKGQKPKVYVGGIGFRGSHGIESTDSRYIPFTWLEAQAVVKPRKGRGHAFLDKEDLLRLKPDVIFLDGGGLHLIKADYGKKPKYYQSIEAFKQKRVYTLFPYNWYTTNLGTTLADAYCIGKILYPQCFTAMDPVKKTNEIYTYLVAKPVYDQMVEFYGPLGKRPPFIK
jgi:iron complex transport system substrate-binding protein